MPLRWYLDDLASGSLEVDHLLTEGECELGSLSRAAEVLAREAPVQDGDGPCDDNKFQYIVSKLRGYHSKGYFDSRSCSDEET